MSALTLQRDGIGLGRLENSMEYAAQDATGHGAAPKRAIEWECCKRVTLWEETEITLRAEEVTEFP